MLRVSTSLFFGKWRELNELAFEISARKLFVSRTGAAFFMWNCFGCNSVDLPNEGGISTTKTNFKKVLSSLTWKERRKKKTFNSRRMRKRARERKRQWMQSKCVRDCTKNLTTLTEAGFFLGRNNWLLWNCEVASDLGGSWKWVSMII